VSVAELQRVLRAAGKRYSHLEEHALHLQAKASK
jgi:hypothetical protein